MLFRKETRKWLLFENSSSILSAFSLLKVATPLSQCRLNLTARLSTFITASFTMDAYRSHDRACSNIVNHMKCLGYLLVKETAIIQCLGVLCVKLEDCVHICCTLHTGLKLHPHTVQDLVDGRYHTHYTHIDTQTHQWRRKMFLSRGANSSGRVNLISGEGCPQTPYIKLD